MRHVHSRQVWRQELSVGGRDAVGYSASVTYTCAEVSCELHARCRPGCSSSERPWRRQ